MSHSPLVITHELSGLWQLQLLPPCLVAQIRLDILKAGLSVEKILIFALVRREEAAEPLEGVSPILASPIQKAFAALKRSGTLTVVFPSLLSFTFTALASRDISRVS